jgi:hypothetical protein
MPSVMDAPTSMEYVETHDFTIEPIEWSPVCRISPGFWRTLAHRIGTFLSSRHRGRQASSHCVSRPYETSMDDFAREYPALALYALALI